MKSFRRVLVIVLAVGMLVGCAFNGFAAPAPKVGIVFDIGGLGDQSFNDSAYVGLQRLANPLDPLSVERIGAHSYQSHPGIEILLIAPYPCSSVFWRRILGAIEKAPCRLRRCDGSGNQG